MDLKEYERAKFELSEILRSTALIAKAQRVDVDQMFDGLFARLAADRLNLVVVGRFSRGKSSLMNAMLNTERLPTGIVPLTSVITTVSYGSADRAYIEYEGWSYPNEISLDSLPDYITQEGNPGNQRRVKVARVELGSEILRRGFHFVDTPGLGSSIPENTRTTLRFLPEADAFMLVTSYDSPLSEEELRVLQGSASSSAQIFLVVNKHDTVSLDQRRRVLSHIREQAQRVFGDAVPRVFSVSAEDALEAIRLHDTHRFSESGVQDLREEIVRFLLEEKQAAFLARTCERVADIVRELPTATEEAHRLRALRQQLAVHRRQTVPADGISFVDLPGGNRTPRFYSCPICRQIERGIYDYLCKYQYDISVRRDVQTHLAEKGGPCALHTWQYQSIASPHGTCLGFPSLLERLAARLSEIAATSTTDDVLTKVEEVRSSPHTCDVCRARIDIENAAVGEMAHSLLQAAQEAQWRFSGVCLPHLPLLVAAINDVGLKRKVLVDEANVLERVSEDMRRYALKHDGVRRSLASDEELDADRRALMLLAGHRNVNGLWNVQ